MIAAPETVAVLLCAGLSRRYGSGNKLMAELDGRPLLAHAAGLLARLPYMKRIAVVGDDEVLAALAGFDIVRNPRPARGQDSSIRIGLAAAVAARPRGILVCLGDMPFVTEAHLAALAEAADDTRPAISSAGQWRSPPLLLPIAVAEQVLEHPGWPVRAVVAEHAAAEVVADPGLLRDLDTPDDFAALSNDP